MTNEGTLTLLRHGAHLRGEYKPIDGQTEGAWGKSTDEERPLSSTSGRLKRFTKNENASWDPQALGWIKAAYGNAIEYTGMRRELEGMAFAVGSFGAVFMGGAALGFFIAAFHLVSLEDPLWYLITIFLTAIVGLFGSGAVAFYLGHFALRQTWRQPDDLPIIFDRQHRKVYRILVDAQPGIKGMFQHWPIKAVEYEWDLIDVEHEAEVFTTGGMINRHHRLVFVVRKSAQDATIIDSFEIANAFSMSEELVPAMWEHIRRFMQEEGPHLPHRTEPLDSRPTTQLTWWQACGEVGPFGNRYVWWWKNQLATSLLYHIVPAFMWGLMAYATYLSIWHPVSLLGVLGGSISLILNWGQGTGIWLAQRSEVKVNWPQEVLERVGTATRRGEGW